MPAEFEVQEATHVPIIRLGDVAPGIMFSGYMSDKKPEKIHTYLRLAKGVVVLNPLAGPMYYWPESAGANWIIHEFKVEGKLALVERT